jgi:urease accessory protein
MSIALCLTQQGFLRLRAQYVAIVETFAIMSSSNLNNYSISTHRFCKTAIAGSRAQNPFISYNAIMQIDYIALLRLMQLADSALPIGSTAHSFGLETLTAEGELSVEQLVEFLRDYMIESGGLESTFCRLGHRLASSTDLESFTADWQEINARLGAYKTARESRNASATLGRRFLQLVLNLEAWPLIRSAMQASKSSGIDMHYSPAFGLVGGVLGVDETATVLAYLQQSLLGLVSACQRLLPLGQSQASQINWQLKPVLLAVAQDGLEAASKDDTARIVNFTPLVECGSMRHPTLTTRLFIS